jgi:hypothetical protein
MFVCSFELIDDSQMFDHFLDFTAVMQLRLWDGSSASTAAAAVSAVSTPVQPVGVASPSSSSAPSPWSPAVSTPEPFTVLPASRLPRKPVAMDLHLRLSPAHVSPSVDVRPEPPSALTHEWLSDSSVPVSQSLLKLGSASVHVDVDVDADVDANHCNKDEAEGEVECPPVPASVTKRPLAPAPLPMLRYVDVEATEPSQDWIDIIEVDDDDDLDYSQHLPHQLKTTP